MKRGGSLDNSTLFYVLVVIALLNFISYLSVKDWNSCAVFVFAGLAMYAFNNSKVFILFIAILVAALSRSVLMEGLENKPKPKKKKEVEVLGISNDIKGASFEGLSQQADKLAKRQTDLFSMAKELGPMMKQAENMMNKLPKGFLENAMQKFNKTQ
jgi:hypothetical protein